MARLIQVTDIIDVSFVSRIFSISSAVAGIRGTTTWGRSPDTCCRAECLTVAIAIHVGVRRCMEDSACHHGIVARILVPPLLRPPGISSSGSESSPCPLPLTPTKKAMNFRSAWQCCMASHLSHTKPGLSTHVPPRPFVGGSTRRWGVRPAVYDHLVKIDRPSRSGLLVKWQGIINPQALAYASSAPIVSSAYRRKKLHCTSSCLDMSPSYFPAAQASCARLPTDPAFVLVYLIRSYFRHMSGRWLKTTSFLRGGETITVFGLLVGSAVTGLCLCTSPEFFSHSWEPPTFCQVIPPSVTTQIDTLLTSVGRQTTYTSGLAICRTGPLCRSARSYGQWLKSDHDAHLWRSAASERRICRLPAVPWTPTAKAS